MMILFAVILYLAIAYLIAGFQWAQYYTEFYPWLGFRKSDVFHYTFFSIAWPFAIPALLATDAFKFGWKKPFTTGGLSDMVTRTDL